eukprot:1160393-Pelagomonas_calceolata.AAC.7
MSVSFQVSTIGKMKADWAMNCDHVCKPRGCGSRLVLKWRQSVLRPMLRYLQRTQNCKINSIKQLQLRIMRLHVSA